MVAWHRILQYQPAVLIPTLEQKGKQLANTLVDIIIAVTTKEVNCLCVLLDELAE